MPPQFQFRYLFTPIKVGPVTVRNRLMVTAHGTGYVDPNPVLGHPGHYGERYAYYLAERAKGGVGLIIAGQAAVHPTSAYEALSTDATAYDREAVPGFKLITQMVHEHGAKIFLQLAHAGAHNAGLVSRLPAWAPSAVMALGSVVGREMPKALEKEEINELLAHYAQSAENGKAGGFDGIEIHAGASYLIHQFLSPLWNHRQDDYGGALENRMRFFLQVIDTVKAVIGEKMALGVRLTVEDFVRSGLTIDDTKEIARRLELTGKVNYINMTTSFHAGPIHNTTMYEPHAPLVPYAAALKETVEIPVVAVVRIVDPREGEKILADGHADLVAMTRGHLADPEIANKAKEGRLDEIRFCTGCCQLCYGSILHHVPVACAQNPAAGREKIWGIGTMAQTTRRKRVMIIGGGPGGMEAAWVAAARGHDVTLYERNQELGGQINLACKLPGRAEMEDYARWRKVMLAKHGVRVVLGTEITAERVLKENPDAVVVATGSTPIRDGFQGVTGETILGWDNPNVVVVDDILQGKAAAGDKVVILDEEAHIKGPGIAHLLASQGKQVEIAARHYFLGNDMDPITRSRVNRLRFEKGFQFSPATFIKSIEDNSVTLYNTVTRATRSVDGATVILITGRKANEELYFALKGKVKDLYRVGDCVSPRLVDAAIYDGHRVGMDV